MCLWERVVYQCGHTARELQKAAYSCSEYRRHVYGPCLLDQYSIVNDVIHPNICSACSDIDRKRQRENWRKTVMKKRN